MTLASVKAVVYLQWDQGQFLIGNIMYQVTRGAELGFVSPLPISGAEIELPYFSELNKGNDEFSQEVGKDPFFKGGGSNRNKPSITSFLCTDVALAIYQRAADEFKELTEVTVTCPEYTPDGATQGALSNAEVRSEVRDFWEYARAINNRGTAHRV
jgi:hypothetical protein